MIKILSVLVVLALAGCSLNGHYVSHGLSPAKELEEWTRAAFQPKLTRAAVQPKVRSAPVIESKPKKCLEGWSPSVYAENAQFGLPGFSDSGPVCIP